MTVQFFGERAQDLMVSSITFGLRAACTSPLSHSMFAAASGTGPQRFKARNMFSGINVNNDRPTEEDIIRCLKDADTINPIRERNVITEKITVEFQDHHLLFQTGAIIALIDSCIR